MLAWVRDTGSNQPTHGGVISLESLYEEIHVIALYYHWGEDIILSLSSAKREMYYEKVVDHVNKKNRNPDEESVEDHLA